MVFVSSELGEHSITTRDVDVNENTIIQFEVHREHFEAAILFNTKTSFNRIFLAYICVLSSMWAAQLKAPLPTRCDSSFPGTSVPHGTFWYPCVLAVLSPHRFAPQSFTLPASISLVPHRAGGGRLFTLESFACVGKDHVLYCCYTNKINFKHLFWYLTCFYCYLFYQLFFLLEHRSIRFRWYQGFFPAGSNPPTWALDNVYIGPQCQDMCNGHGACVGGSHCVCDPGYSGPDCSLPDTPNPDFLKEDFEGTKGMNLFIWILWSWGCKVFCRKIIVFNFFNILNAKLVQHIVN